MAEPPITNQTVLAVFPRGEDRRVLKNIFRFSNWKLRFAWSFEKARSALQAFQYGVVITEGRFPDGRSWKDLLRLIQDAVSTLPLIVADRLADEHLWAEVLNLGGYDLLMKPFNAKEVLHAVSTACLFRENEERASGLRGLAKGSQSSESVSGRTARAAAAGSYPYV